MHLTEWSLREPAGRAARVAALSLLSRVRENRDRLDGAPDSEALHDFRVSVRRLRSWLRAFDGLLDDTLSSKSQRRLKRIAEATGASRDLEVHLVWVHDRRPTLRGEQRRGADWLIEHLERRKAASDLELKQMVDAEFDRATDRVEKSMSSYSASVVEIEPRFAAVSARLVRRHAAAVTKALRAVTHIGDRAEAHAARIATKRLRYLLDPLDDALPDVKAIVGELGELQDRLGELHDAQLFGSEIATSVAELLGAQVTGGTSAPSPPAKKKRGRSADDPIPGLLAVARRLRRAEEAAFAAIDKTWLRKGSAPLLARVDAVAQALDRIAKEGREIGRRYLLKGLPGDAPPATVAEVDAGFVAGERFDEEIRRETSDGADVYYRTINNGSGDERGRLVEQTSERTFAALWPLTKGSRVRVRRHRIAADDHAWNVYEFLDRPLILAAVELEHEDSVPALPEWLQSVLEKDVSDDEAYGLKSLAK